MPIVGTRKFILTSLTSEYPSDLICCGDSLDFEFIKDSLRLRGQGFEILSESDAIKLLASDNTLGYGCYLGSNNPTENTNRSMKAKALYLGIASEFGVVRDHEPVELQLSYLSDPSRVAA